jgi:hypothetical protein
MANLKVSIVVRTTGPDGRRGWVKATGKNETLTWANQAQRSPGVYYLQVLYQSNYPKEEGFGLPLLTFDDGEFRSNKIQIQVRLK